MRRIRLEAILIAVLCLPALGVAALQFDFDHGAIGYTTTEPTDPVAKLQARIDSGEVKLRFDPERGYLPAVLEELKIPRTSQSLVFSKTSLQLLLISPQTPRAIYFNDEVYIGSVQSSPLMEVASIDPKLGAVYDLNGNPDLFLVVFRSFHLIARSRDQVMHPGLVRHHHQGDDVAVRC